MDAIEEILDVSHLPITAQRIVEVIGLSATVKLVDIHGGQQLRLYASGLSMKRVIASIGEDAAWKLHRAFGIDEFEVPSCGIELKNIRNAEIHAMFDKMTKIDGKSARETMFHLNDIHKMSVRHLWRILKKPSIVQRVKKPLGDPRQMSLL